MKKLFLITLSIIVLTACAPQTEGAYPGMGMGNNMMNRHHAQIPAEYAGLKNSVPADEASLERGVQLYVTNCASCHGDGGMGDGPVGVALDPAPSPIAHTSQMMEDDYLFWRISEGGLEFNTSMPPWKDALDEQSRWDLINYVRALGAGTVKPDSIMGGVPFDPTAQAIQQAEILAKAVEQKVVTQAEADLFITVHDAMEQYRIDHPELTNSGDNATDREAAILSALVAEGIVSQAQVDAFPDIHDRLGNAGLMP